MKEFYCAECDEDVTLNHRHVAVEMGPLGTIHNYRCNECNNLVDTAVEVNDKMNYATEMIEDYEDVN